MKNLWSISEVSITIFAMGCICLCGFKIAEIKERNKRLQSMLDWEARKNPERTIHILADDENLVTFTENVQPNNPDIPGEFRFSVGQFVTNITVKISFAKGAK